MALFDKFEEQFGVVYGSNQDVCFYCLREAIHYGEEKDPSYVRDQLLGHCTGKKILRLKASGGIVICKKHIKKIYEAMGGDDPTEVEQLEKDFDEAKAK